MRWGGKGRRETREVGVKIHFFFFKIKMLDLLCGILLLHVYEQQKCSVLCILILYLNISDHMCLWPLPPQGSFSSLVAVFILFLSSVWTLQKPLGYHRLPA